jgi:hypothetical protein
MADAEDMNFSLDHFEHDTIISDPELPISFEGLSQGFAIFLRGNQEAVFDRSSNPLTDICVELRDISCLDLRVVDRRKRHITPRPQLFMG